MREAGDGPTKSAHRPQHLHVQRLQLRPRIHAELVPQHGPGRTGDVRHSRADITRIRRELGYEPTLSFEEGLKRTLSWYGAEVKF